ncbi:hypothetical protein [Acetobacter persici]|uniref:hypothetical protein n=1 Tax=Acetobacter persici TaxID=1076596 RepID=UPI0039EB0533
MKEPTKTPSISRTWDANITLCLLRILRSRQFSVGEFSPDPGLTTDRGYIGPKPTFGICCA